MKKLTNNNLKSINGGATAIEYSLDAGNSGNIISLNLPLPAIEALRGTRRT